MKSLIQKNQITAFILLSYAISWICWFPILDQVKADLYSSPLHVILLLLAGGYSPSVSALVLSRLIGGKRFVKDLLARFKILKIKFKWYAIAFLVGPVLTFVGIMIYVSQGGVLGWANYMVFVFLPVFFLVASVFGPLGEELGWRGYLLPRILLKHNVFVASILVGIIWAFWHTPLFWAQEGTSISGLPVTPLNVFKYLVYAIGISWIITLVLRNTRGSVFFAFLIHASTNGSAVALSYLFPNIVDKKAIWNIEVWVLGTCLIIGGVFELIKFYKTQNPNNQTHTI